MRWLLLIGLLGLTMACVRTPMPPLPTLESRYPTSSTTTATPAATLATDLRPFTQPEGYQPFPWQPGKQLLPIIPAPKSPPRISDLHDTQNGGRLRALPNGKVLDPHTGQQWSVTPNGYLITDQGLRRAVPLR